MNLPNWKNDRVCIFVAALSLWLVEGRLSAVTPLNKDGLSSVTQRTHTNTQDRNTPMNKNVDTPKKNVTDFKTWAKENQDSKIYLGNGVFLYKANTTNSSDTEWMVKNGDVPKLFHLGFPVANTDTHSSNDNNSSGGVTRVAGVHPWVLGLACFVGALLIMVAITVAILARKWMTSSWNARRRRHRRHHDNRDNFVVEADPEAPKIIGPSATANLPHFHPAGRCDRGPSCFHPAGRSDEDLPPYSLLSSPPEQSNLCDFSREALLPSLLPISGYHRHAYRRFQNSQVDQDNDLITAPSQVEPAVVNDCDNYSTHFLQTGDNRRGIAESADNQDVCYNNTGENMCMHVNNNSQVARPRDNQDVYLQCSNQNSNEGGHTVRSNTDEEEVEDREIYQQQQQQQENFCCHHNSQQHHQVYCKNVHCREGPCLASQSNGIPLHLGCDRYAHVKGAHQQKQSEKLVSNLLCSPRRNQRPSELDPYLSGRRCDISVIPCNAVEPTSCNESNNGVFMNDASAGAVACNPTDQPSVEDYNRIRSEYERTHRNIMANDANLEFLNVEVPAFYSNSGEDVCDE